MTLNSSLVSQAVFHPRPELPGRSPRGMLTQTRCDDAVVCGYLHSNPASDNLLLFFHGNGEVAADYDGLSSLFTACGVWFWVVDYRGYGRSTGTPSFSQMLRDAEAVMDDVPRLAERVGRQFTRVLVMGRSLGSASAIHIASRRTASVDGLILDSPFADGLALIRRLGGPALSREAIPGFEDNLDKIHRCALPTLIIHGAEDQIIPIADAEALHAACPSPSRHLFRIRGAGHNDLLIIALQEYCRTLTEFVARVSHG